MAEDTGKRLLERGWHQGSYFGPLSHLIHFKIDEPLRIPKPAIEEAQRAFVEATKTGQDRPQIGQAVRLGRARDRWVLVTHECDLVKPESIEPYATAIRCFPTDNDRVLRAA